MSEKTLWRPLRVANWILNTHTLFLNVKPMDHAWNNNLYCIENHPGRLSGELILSEIMGSDFFVLFSNLLRFVLGEKYYSSSIQTIS